MATAQRIDTLPPSVSLQSPLLAEELAAQTSKIVRLETASEAPASSSRTRKAVLTTSAPKLNPTAPSQASAPNASYMSQLAIYMIAMVLFQVFLAKAGSTINDAQNTTQNELVNQSTEQANKAKEQNTEYEKAKEEEDHQSFWSKLVGIFASIVSAILTAITAGAAAFIVVGVVTVLMQTGVLDKLTNQLGSSSFESFAAKLGIVLGATLAGCALGGAVEGTLAAMTESESGEAGGLGLATEAENAGAPEEEDVEALVADDAADGASGLIPSGSGAAGGDAPGAVEEEVGAAEVQQQASTASKAAKFRQGFIKGGFSKAMRWTTFAQMLVTINPTVDLVTAIAKKAGADDNLALLLGSTIGTAADLVGAFGASTYGTTLADGEVPPEPSRLGKTWLGNWKSLLVLNLLQGSFTVVGGYFGIESGLTTLKISDIEKTNGEIKKEQTITQADLEMVDQMMQAEQKTLSSQLDVISQITNKFNAFVQPGATAASILG